MISLLIRWFSLRHFKTSPLRYLIVIVTIALGVASYLSIKIASRSSVQSFASFTEAVSGQSDITILHQAGQLPLYKLEAIREILAPLPVQLFPILQKTGTLRIDSIPETYSLIGIDLVALRNVTGRNSLVGIEPGQSLSEDTELVDVLNRRDLVYIPEVLAHKKGLKVGDFLPLTINTTTYNLIVDGIIEAEKTRVNLPANILVFDLKTLAALSDSHDLATSVEGLIAQGEIREQFLTEARQRLSQYLEEGFILLEPDSTLGSPESMTQAFRLNLFILSLIALLVGLFLIVQALDASVVQRRPEIATLRSLGVSGGQIWRLFLLESLLLGFLGTLVGIGLGYGLSYFSVSAIKATVNTLYTQTADVGIVLTSADILIAVAIGMVTSVLAALIPAKDAASTPPAQQLRLSASAVRGVTFFRSPFLGLFPLAVAVLLAFLPPLILEGPTNFPLGGYASAIMWLIGISILSGWFLKISGLLLPSTTPAAYVAKRHLLMATARHRLATAGLTIAITMSAAMLILVGSFEHTLKRWVNTTINGHIYVSPPGFNGADTDATLDPDFIRKLEKDSRFSEIGKIIIQKVYLAEQQVTLVGENLHSPHREYLWIQKPEKARILSGGTAVEPVFVSEPFSRKFNLGRGDLFTIPTPYGPRKAIIAGIYAEYGNEQGSITAQYETVSEWFNTQTATRLTLIVSNEHSIRETLAAYRLEYPDLIWRDNNDLRREIFRIFRATFSVTYGLQLISIIVALSGLALALLSLVLETKEETRTLKTLGMSRRQLSMLMAWEGGGIALAGVIGGLLSSMTLGWLLIYVVNRQSFGWTLQLSVPIVALSAFCAVILSTSFAVSYAIGWHNSEKSLKNQKDT